MQIAIPEHQGRVAPVFDTCRHLLVYTQADESHAIVHQEDWSGVSTHGRATRLKELEVDVLLCGGISCEIEDQMHLQGIRLIAWLAGDVSEVLKAFRHGTIMNPEYAMPGTFLCRKRRQTRQNCRSRTKRTSGVNIKEQKPCQD
jgi:predicted Fe-Mo cluster-binding NifX family protein